MAADHDEYRRPRSKNSCLHLYLLAMLVVLSSVVVCQAEDLIISPLTLVSTSDSATLYVDNDGSTYNPALMTSTEDTLDIIAVSPVSSTQLDAVTSSTSVSSSTGSPVSVTGNSDQPPLPSVSQMMTLTSESSAAGVIPVTTPSEMSTMQLSSTILASITEVPSISESKASSMIDLPPDASTSILAPSPVSTSLLSLITSASVDMSSQLTIAESTSTDATLSESSPTNSNPRDSVTSVFASDASSLQVPNSSSVTSISSTSVSTSTTSTLAHSDSVSTSTLVLTTSRSEHAASPTSDGSDVSSSTSMVPISTTTVEGNFSSTVQRSVFPNLPETFTSTAISTIANSFTTTTMSTTTASSDVTISVLITSLSSTSTTATANSAGSGYLSQHLSTTMRSPLTVTTGVRSIISAKIEQSHVIPSQTTTSTIRPPTSPQGSSVAVSPPTHPTSLGSFLNPNTATLYRLAGELTKITSLARAFGNTKHIDWSYQTSVLAGSRGPTGLSSDVGTATMATNTTVDGPTLALSITLSTVTVTLLRYSTTPVSPIGAAKYQTAVFQAGMSSSVPNAVPSVSSITSTRTTFVTVTHTTIDTITMSLSTTSVASDTKPSYSAAVGWSSTNLLSDVPSTTTKTTTTTLTKLDSFTTLTIAATSPRPAQLTHHETMFPTIMLPTPVKTRTMEFPDSTGGTSTLTTILTIHPV